MNISDTAAIFAQILSNPFTPELSNNVMLAWQALFNDSHMTDTQIVQAYQDRISQLFAGGADILDIKARSELASLVGLKVSSARPFLRVDVLL